MKIKNITLLIVVLLLLDQILKIWIKTHLRLDEAIEVFSWFQLRFVENNGAAFGMQIASDGGFDWGKLLLSLFRIVMIGLLGYYI
ncbi:MAG: signal peptidase II, partial [Alistipes sp.]|nr:signal peptidase II [Alistipes sp.]